MIDYLEKGHTINCANYAGELSHLLQEIARKNVKKTDSLCSALAGQGPYPHDTSCHDCCD